MLTPARTESIAPGTRVTVRGDEWIVAGVTRHTGCETVRLTGCGRANAGAARTLLTPFDRLRPSARREQINVLSHRRWLWRVSLLLRDTGRFGSLSTAAGAGIRLLPFQIEPALAMLRHARLRLLIADEVGLGKTIQAGVLLRQLSADTEAFRALIVTPAGVREQWQQELDRRFELAATVADAAWLMARTRDLPPDVNPWSLPGIYIASLDLVKRPEVLRALEDVTWDITVVDEVHGAGVGTARLAAADAVARTARRVVLLTATPPDAEPAHFDAIAGIGSHGSRAPLTQFRRSRTDAGVNARRKSVLLPVRLSTTERRMHRLLDRYTRLVWSEAGARDDSRARLAAVILRKRALSSAASLALSIRRRLLLLATTGSTPAAQTRQMLLPLLDEDVLDDPPDSVLGASGLSDVALERACLEGIRTVAERAARDESKLALLQRFLSRTAEPMIIFTEYRDTLMQLAATVARLRPVLQLHGGMTPGERASVQRAFNASGTVLLATDAASEGLNLHERCRLVVHFELPWTPARLEQRTGRVDRLGQTRRVHEVLLVARHTSERLVLAPLLKRSRIAAARGGPSARIASLTESNVAGAVMAGVDVLDETAIAPPHVATMNIRAEAEAAVGELEVARRLTRAGKAGSSGRERDGIAVTTAGGRFFTAILFLVEVGLEQTDRRSVHREVVPLLLHCSRRRTPRRPQDAARLAEDVMRLHSARVCGLAEESCRERFAVVTAEHQQAVHTLTQRERDIATASPSAARRLVQVGLFDARESHALAARRKTASLALLDADDRVADLAPDAAVRTTARVVAVRFGWERRQ